MHRSASPFTMYCNTKHWLDYIQNIVPQSGILILLRILMQQKKVQRRATKLISSITTLSYETILDELDIHSLYCRRQRGNLIEVYKILHSMHNNPKDVFILRQGNVMRGHNLELIPALLNTFSVVQQWNNLINGRSVYGRDNFNF